MYRMDDIVMLCVQIMMKYAMSILKKKAKNMI